MKYDIGDIKREVRITLDENSVGVPLVGEMDNDTLSLDEIIESKIVDGIKKVTLSAPAHLLEGGKTFASTINWESDSAGKGMGYTMLPEDFMRLMVFQMSDWKRPVTQTIHEADARYFLQKSKFIGIKGGTEKPVCAIVTYPEGRVMEFYSCNGGENVWVKIAKYLPLPEVKEGQVDICPRLYASVVYYVAGTVCSVLKDKEQAAVLFSLAKDLMK